MMPEMDGLTLCRKIRQNVNINYLPIILLPARTARRTMWKLDTGADAYLMKPFSIELLRKTVLNLIRRREQLRNAFSGRQNQEEQISIPEVKSPDDRLMERVMRVINENLGNPALTVRNDQYGSRYQPCTSASQAQRTHESDYTTTHS